MEDNGLPSKDFKQSSNTKEYQLTLCTISWRRALGRWWWLEWEKWMVSWLQKILSPENQQDVVMDVVMMKNKGEEEHRNGYAGFWLRSGGNNDTG